MRYLAVDLGSKKIGLSISDKTATIASAYDTLEYESDEKLLNDIRGIIEKEKIDEVVVGNPLNLDGTLSKRSIVSLEFKKKLEIKLGIKVHLQDERYSTKEAENILISNNMRRKRRKKVIDKLASVIILETFLSRK